MDYDIAQFEEKLIELSDLERLGFGICLLERALPMFYAFQAETNHAGMGEVMASLAACWKTMEDGRWGEPAFLTSNECEKVMPDSEDYDSFYTSAALDAVDICCSLLDFIHAKDIRSIVAATQVQLDTLDLATQRLLDEDGVGDDHRLVQEPTSLLSLELNRMQDDLFFLAASSAQSEPLASQLRRRVLELNYRQIELIRRAE